MTSRRVRFLPRQMLSGNEDKNPATYYTDPVSVADFETLDIEARLHASSNSAISVTVTVETTTDPTFKDWQTISTIVIGSVEAKKEHVAELLGTIRTKITFVGGYQAVLSVVGVLREG